MLYLICTAGAVAFLMGWVEGSFALMMKVGLAASLPFSAGWRVLALPWRQTLLIGKSLVHSSIIMQKELRDRCVGITGWMM